jgi:hypothetical protein
MNPRWLFLALLGILCGEDESVCVHPSVGETRRISLDDVRRAQEAVRARLAWAVAKAGKVSLDTPFDSGLPACRARQRRTLRTEVPRELVGKTIGLGPSGRIPRADFRAATSARSLSDVDAELLADRALTERLGVRCSPTRVTFRTEGEIELDENP